VNVQGQLYRIAGPRRKEPQVRTFAAKIRMLASAVALSALAGVGSFLGTYRVLTYLSGTGVELPVVTATVTASAQPGLPGSAAAASSPRAAGKGVQAGAAPASAALS
jgi:hypothetical protein